MVVIPSPTPTTPPRHPLKKENNNNKFFQFAIK